MSKKIIVTGIVITVVIFLIIVIFISQKQENEKLFEHICPQSSIVEDSFEGQKKVLGSATDCFGKLKIIYGTEKARQLTVEWFKQQAIIKDAGISIDGTTIWLKYLDNTETLILTGIRN